MDKEQKNTFQTSEVVFLIIITCVVSILMGFTVANRFETPSKINSENEFVSKILKNYEYIKENYYEEVDDNTLLNGAIAGMLDSLDDPFSTFIDETVSEKFNMALNGSFSGIGIQVMNDKDNNIVIVGIFENSPAKKAGLQVNDIIKAINKKNLLGKDKSELTNYIKENKLESFALTVLRQQKEIVIEVTKEDIIIPSVVSKMFEQNNQKVGYIYFNIFSSTTYTQFQKELDSLKKQGFDSLIIDVRENSGGHLTTTVDIVSLFLDNKHVIYQIETKDKTTKYYSNGSNTETYPIVVLQDQKSASAAELLSAALKESYGATIIGETSYGKGTVQQLVTLEDGIEYKFTTKKWLTPNGNWIHKKGIEPDIKVSLNQDYYSNPSAALDNQLQEAIHYLTK